MQKSQFSITAGLLCAASVLLACVNSPKTATTQELLKKARTAVMADQYDKR